ncbi:MAG: hypothetical protein GEU26_09385 [Nitrososphaeraceae archaeon]|nr:hypothetical protein [Nitrososphaeraceae archaeon]
MHGNTELNIIAAGSVLGLLGILVSLSMQSSLSPIQNISAQITPADPFKAMDTTVPSETEILSEDNQSTSSTPVGTLQNATVANSSNIIQSAVLPPQLPIIPVSSTSNTDDDDDDEDEDDRTNSNGNDDNGDDDEDDRTNSNGNDDNGDDDSGRRSISIRSGGGGVSVSVG